MHEKIINTQATTKKKNFKSKDFLRFLEIVDCCRYFSQQGGLDKLATTQQSMSTVNILIARILTPKEQQTVEKDGMSIENKHFSLSNLNSKLFIITCCVFPCLGVIVQQIDDFYRRWRQSTPEKS